MTIKVGNQYIHTVLGYVDDSGTTVITEDPELATMTGKYSDTSAEESTDPAAYEWEEIDLMEPDAGDEEDEEDGDDATDLLFRLADTQMVESIQENLVTGTNQGTGGWQVGTGTLEAAACSPEENGTTVNGVRWMAAANDTLSRTMDIAGEAVPESVTVSFWWNASAQCGLTASIGDNVSEKQYNYDSADLDEDGNALDLSGAWLFFEARVPISTEADSYPVKITADSAAVIDLCDFKVEPGDKTTEWTTSSKEAMDAANTEAANRRTIIREYNGGVLVAKTGQTIGALVNADGSFDVIGVSWDGETPTVTSTLYARYGAETTILNGNGDYIKLSNGSVEVSGTIKGATLEGAKLTGENIFIGGDYTHDEELHTKASLVASVIDQGSYKSYALQMSATGEKSSEYIGTAIVDVDASNGVHLYADRELKLVLQSVQPIVVYAPSEDALYKSFDSDIVSSGTVLVTQKMGWCAVTAIVTLSAAASGWTDILTVPATQHGYNLYTTVPANNSTTIKPLSARIASAGTLQLRYGGAGTYYFELVYPIA